MAKENFEEKFPELKGCPKFINVSELDRFVLSKQRVILERKFLRTHIMNAIREGTNIDIAFKEFDERLGLE